MAISSVFLSVNTDSYQTALIMVYSESSQNDVKEDDELVGCCEPLYQAEKMRVPIISEALRDEFVHGHAGQRRVLLALTSMSCFLSNVADATEFLQQCGICLRRTKPMFVSRDTDLFSWSVLPGAKPFSIVCADVMYIKR
ncbi:hypothetical protein FOL46_002740, partial [Perkinsus olseni]